MKCKVCNKRMMTCYALGKFRQIKVGYYCPKCQRLVHHRGEIREEVPVGTV